MKTKGLSILSAIALMLTLAIIPACMAQPTEPKNADAIWLEPSITTISGSTFLVDLAPYAIGDRFNITVWANCSFICGGWSIRLVYEKTTIQALKANYTGTDALKSEFFQNVTTIPVGASMASINTTHARVDYGESAFPPSLRDPGYGSLCTVEFNVTSATPASVLTFTELPGSASPKTYFLNSTGGKPPINAFGGTVVPEFAPALLLSLLALVTIPTAVILRKKKF